MQSNINTQNAKYDERSKNIWYIINPNNRFKTGL